MIVSQEIPVQVFNHGFFYYRLIGKTVLGTID